MSALIPDIVAARITEEQLTMEVTARCNAECTYCFARAGGRGAAELDEETARAVVREGRELGYRRLHLTGGEPFLWNPLYSVIDYARGLGFEEVFINTNGTVIGSDEIEKLRGYKENLSFSVSLDWPEDLHDRRRGENSFAAASRGLALLLGAEMRCCVFSCLDSANISELPRMAEHLFHMHSGIDHLTIIPLHDGESRGGAINRAPTGFSTVHAESFLAMVRAAAFLNLYGWTTAVLDTPLAAAAARAMGMPWMPRALPRERPGRITVLADGTVTIAHSTNVSFGIFGRTSLESALASSEYARTVTCDRTACAGCAFSEPCGDYGVIPILDYSDGGGETLFCRRVLGGGTESP